MCTTRTISCSLLIAIVAFIHPPTSYAIDDPQVILKAWAEAYATRSGDSIAVLYTQDAQLWGTVSTEPTIGIERIKEYYEKGGQSVKARSVTFGKTNMILRTDSAFISGQYQFSAIMKDGSPRENAAR